MNQQQDYPDPKTVSNANQACKAETGNRGILNFASANQGTDKIHLDRYDTLSKVVIDTETTDEHAQRLKEVIAKHANVFPSKETPLGRSKLYRHKIYTTKPYR